MSAPDPRFEIVGETFVDDPRERMARAVAQLIDKPLTVILVIFAFALAAKGPGWVFPGYEPSDLAILGLWLCFSLIARTAVKALLSLWRRATGIAAPKSRFEDAEAPATD
ncbi:MAG: hypothetical protein ACFCUS_00410 [Rubrimonas sp.]|uniref:hypothetical protein n=1 Tax=Rubrimonas sp. TaxID=2036015 RepID=UPI002FDCEE46